jgi:hypothetical protein
MGLLNFLKTTGAAAAPIDPIDRMEMELSQAVQDIQTMRDVVANEMARALMEKRDADPNLARTLSKAKEAIKAMQARIADAKADRAATLALGATTDMLRKFNASTLGASLLVNAPASTPSAPASPEIDKVGLTDDLVEAMRLIADEQTADRLLPALSLLESTQSESSVGERSRIVFVRQALELSKKLDEVGSHEAAFRAVKLAMMPLYAVPGDTTADIVELRESFAGELRRLKSKIDASKGAAA